MRWAIILLLILFILAYSKHSKEPGTVFNAVKNICTKECEGSGFTWGQGVYFDESVKAYNCFCRKGKY